MKKKHILITGSTDGVGKLSAISLASQGHVVYLHGRNANKLNAAIAEVKEKSNSETVDGFIADLSDLNAVKQMAAEISSKLTHIDVLINNAGVFKSAISHTKKGIDLCFAVNYLAPYALSKELISLIEKGSDATIINLSSAAQSSISYDAMLGKQSISVNESYAQSKLALTMWSHYLAKQLKDITVIAVNPGSLLNTKMANEAYGQHWSPAEKGSDILVDLALNHAHKLHSGDYFDNDSGAYASAHPDTYNEMAVSQLIEFTNTLID